MKSKYLTNLLAALLLLSAVPTAALAAETDKSAPLIAPTPIISVQPLQDLPADYWAHDAAVRLMSLEIMAPVQEGSFAPEALFTREMFVSALWHMSGKPTVNAVLSFQDVDAASEHAEAIRWAAADGIVSGYTEDTFGPQDSITREQMAKMVYTYVKKYDMGFQGMWMFQLPYEDAKDIAEWAFEPMHWMVASHIIQGVTPTLLMPQGTVTRAQGAVMLSRLLDTAAEKGVDFLAYGKAER